MWMKLSHELRAFSVVLAASTVVGCGSSGSAGDSPNGEPGGPSDAANPADAGVDVDIVQPSDAGGPKQELCNGLDDDLDGTVDEGCACTSGQTQACFSGDLALAGKGLCVMGEQTCESSGEFASWGPCIGSGAPSNETCEDSIDQNCDGVDPACPVQCGNGTCDGDESCELCASDCGQCPPDPCGGNPHGSSQSRTMYQTSSVPYGGQCLEEQQTRTCNDGTWSEWTGTFSSETCQVGTASPCNVPGYGSLSSGQQLASYTSASVPCGSTCSQVTISCNNGVLSGGSSYVGSCTPQACPTNCNLPGYGTLSDGQQVASYTSSSVPCGSTCTQVTISCNNGVLSGGSSYVGSCAAQTCSPFWPMFRNNATGSAITQNQGPKSGTKQWDYAMAGNIVSTPAVDGSGSIYLGAADGTFVSLTHGGAKRWEYKTGGPIVGSPALDTTGQVYFASGDSFLYAFSLDGSFRWKQPSASAVTSPIAAGNRVYVVNTAGVLRAHSLSGSLDWTFNGAAYTTTPAVDASGTLYLASATNQLIAVNSGGVKLWGSLPSTCTVKRGTSIAIAPNGTLYSVCGQYLYANASNGSLLWEHRLATGSVGGAAAVASDGTVYVTDSESLFAIHSNGTQKWRQLMPNTGMTGVSSPIVAGDGSVYFGMGTTIYGVTSSGAGLFALATSGTVHSSPSIGMNGRLFIGGGDNKVYAIGP